jgi:Tfp pilus assembly protein PilF
MTSELNYRPHISVLCFVLLTALSSSYAQGPSSPQPRELRGQVNQADGTPYRDGALVKVEDDRGGTVAEIRTDSGGKFDVTTPQNSRYTVTVHAPGFHDATAEADLTTLPRVYIQLTLHVVAATGLPPSRSAASDILSVNDLNAPAAAQSEFEKGRSMLVDKHKAADSIKPLLKAVQIAPAYSQAHFLLGTAYMDTGKWTDAESELNKAVSLNDKLGPADLALGSCLIEEKKFADAEKPLLRGLELLPDDSQGYYDLGRTYYTLSRFAEAEERARKAIALAPDFAEAHLLLGNVLLRQRDGAHALTEFQEYLRLAPDGPFAGPAQELVKKLQVGLADAH